MPAMPKMSSEEVGDCRAFDGIDGIFCMFFGKTDFSPFCLWLELTYRKIKIEKGFNVRMNEDV